MSPIDLNIEIDLIRHDFLKGFICTFHCAKYDEHVEYAAQCVLPVMTDLNSNTLFYLQITLGTNLMSERMYNV